MAILCYPHKVVQLLRPSERAQSHMRYSAATGGPNGLKERGFTLRHRRTEPFVVYDHIQRGRQPLYKD